MTKFYRIATIAPNAQLSGGKGQTTDIHPFDFARIRREAQDLHAESVARSKTLAVVAVALIAATVVVAGVLVGHWLAQPKLDQAGLAVYSEQAALAQLFDQVTK